MSPTHVDGYDVGDVVLCRGPKDARVVRCNSCLESIKAMLHPILNMRHQQYASGCPQQNEK